MAEGNETYNGLAVPLYGESEIQAQTAATDILTLTGATSHSGDFIVMQNSTGAELAYVDINGKGTFVGGLALSGSATLTQATIVVSATTQTGGLTVSVTSTGAIAAGATGVNGFLVAPSSKAVLNAAFAYSNVDSTVGTCNYLLACHGSKAPTYFLGIGGTAVGVGAATDNGFVNAGVFLTSALATTVPMVGLRVQFGDSVFYIMCCAETALS